MRKAMVWRLGRMWVKKAQGRKRDCIGVSQRPLADKLNPRLISGASLLPREVLACDSRLLYILYIWKMIL